MRDEALDGCRRAAHARGEYGVVRDGRRPPKAQVGAWEGFDLHACVVIGATDHEGRERLLRYVARPTVASGRVSELADRRVAWLLKVPGGRGETHRIMEPMEFMARLAAPVPPRRFPLVGYHGVFAPNSPWRIAVVPPPSGKDRRGACAGATASVGGVGSVPQKGAPPAEAGRTTDDPWMEMAPAAEAAPGDQRAGRMDWATLLHRVWGWDVLACPRCEGRMRFIAVLTERAVIERILTHVGLSAARIVAAPTGRGRRWRGRLHRGGCPRELMANPIPT